MKKCRDGRTPRAAPVRLTSASIRRRKNTQPRRSCVQHRSSVRERPRPEVHALKPSAAFAYRTTTRARAQSALLAPFHRRANRSVLTRSRTLHQTTTTSSVSSRAVQTTSAILTVKDSIRPKVEGDACFPSGLCLKGQAEGCCVDASWLPARGPSSCFGTSKAALNFSRANDSGGTRSLTRSPSNQEQRQLLFPSYNYL